MKRSILFAIPLLVAGSPAFAGTLTTQGNQTLALAALIGTQSPLLSHAEKTVLQHFLDGDTAFTTPAGITTITVNSEKVTCRVGDVDLTMHSCDLTFGSVTVSEKGLRSEALSAAMIINGAFADGAAGSIYYSVAPISCTINVAEIKAPDGGGAKCTFTTGP